MSPPITSHDTAKYVDFVLLRTGYFPLHRVHKLLYISSALYEITDSTKSPCRPHDGRSRDIAINSWSVGNREHT